MRRVSALVALVLAVPVATACSADRDTTSAPAAPSASLAPSGPATPGTSGRGPVRPRTAKQALTLLLAAERAVRDPATGERDLVAAARQQQLAYRELGTRPGWDAVVLAGFPPGLRADVRANVASRREFRSMHTTLSGTLPAWRIVDPEPAAALLRAYRRGERAHGVPWEFLAAINLVETGLGRIRGTSVAGARGPMQFIPSTWARWGRGDIEDAGDAIMAAARYLAHNGGARPSGIATALYRYNNDVRYVRGVTALAQVMERDPAAFRGYYRWDVYYLTARGDVRLPVGYARTSPISVDRWLATHPRSSLVE